MREACSQAERGLGKTAPNPAVGCVIVKGGRELARGYHRRAGRPHAEIEALRRAGVAARGATAYVTLEPCCHHGKTGPCTEALVVAGVARVVAGCRDPDPRVAGKGLAALRRRGIETRSGVEKARCEDLIRGFSHWVAHGEPWVHLKLAASLDGRIAAHGGESKWISSPESRTVVQSLRARADAIAVGVGTVLADDPRLTCRLRGARHPLRVILDSAVRTPPDARVVTGDGECVIACSADAPAARIKRVERAGAEVFILPGRGERRWRNLLMELGRRSTHELLLEGGSAVATSALTAGVVNAMTVFYNARLIGADGVPLVGPLGVTHPENALQVQSSSWTPCGPDLMWTGRFSR